VTGVPMAKQPGLEVIDRASSARVRRQVFQAVTEAEEIGIGPRFAEGAVRIKINVRQVAVGLVGQDIVSHAAGAPWPPP
jgi:hypothetical protein